MVRFALWWPTTFFLFVFCFCFFWLFLGRWLTSWDHTGQENSSYTRLDNWKQGDGAEQKRSVHEYRRKRADLGSFSDRTGYNNKMIFFVCFFFCFLFVFFVCFVLFSMGGGVIINSIENVHSCGWNSSYLLRWPSIVPENV